MTHSDKEEMGQEIAREIGRTIGQKIGIGFALLFGFLFFVIFGGVVVQWLWNWLVPDLFGLRTITVWEALGLLALSRILFGSFGGGRSHSRSDRKDWWKKKRHHRHGGPTPPDEPSANSAARLDAGAS